MLSKEEEKMLSLNLTYQYKKGSKFWIVYRTFHETLSKVENLLQNHVDRLDSCGSVQEHNQITKVSQDSQYH
jgi:hypothetical protein